MMNELQPTRTIQTVTLEIKTLHAQAQQVILGYAIEIGRRLTEAKSLLDHGQWGDWLKNEVAFSKSTANNFMRIFEEYGAEQMGLFGAEAKSQALGDLPYTKALKLLALPADEREEFAEEHNVGELSTRELDQLIKERDTARAEADESAKALAEVQQYMKDTAVENQNSREAMERRQAQAQQESEQATAELEDLRQQLQLIQDEVVVEVIPTVDTKAVADAVAKAKADTERKLKAKIETMEKAKTAADDAKAKAESALATATVAQEEAQRLYESERDEMTAQVQTLQKKLAVASSSEMAIFKLHFEQCQVSVNKMVESLSKMQSAGDEAGAEKLKNALTTLLSVTLGVME